MASDQVLICSGKASAMNAWSRSRTRAGRAERKVGESDSQPERELISVILGVIAARRQRCRARHTERAYQRRGDSGIAAEIARRGLQRWPTVDRTSGRAHYRTGGLGA